MIRAGILAVGGYLPAEVRSNAVWPADRIAAWLAGRSAAPRRDRTGLTAGEVRVLDAMEHQARDPFLETVERRIAPPELDILDLEARAASSALERAGVSPREVDVLLVHSVVPDYQLANSACGLHARLGCRGECLTLSTEATAYTSLAQLAIAEAMVVAGRARRVLCVQSCLGSRIVEMTDPSSLLLGDGATAFLVGAVAGDRGVLSTSHFTDGASVDGLVMSVPGGRWYDPGTPRVHVANPKHLAAAQLQIADTCARAVDEALATANVSRDEIAALIVYQGTPWLQRVVYEQLGITRLTPYDIFARYGYLSSAMLPAAIWEAEQAGQIADDDLVVLVGGGTGMTYGAAVLRWGNK